MSKVSHRFEGDHLGSESSHWQFSRGSAWQTGGWSRENVSCTGSNLDEAKGCRDVALEKDGFTYKDPKDTVQNWFTVTTWDLFCFTLHVQQKLAGRWPPRNSMRGITSVVLWFHFGVSSRKSTSTEGGQSKVMFVCKENLNNLNPVTIP